jgi:Flp pilus assembly protein CpaB
MKKKWWIIIAVVAVVAFGYVGYAVWQGGAAQQAMADSGLETSVVERGTIRVTIDGSGPAG